MRSQSSSPLQLLVQKGVVPMRLQELPPVAQQAQEQQPFFTAGFPFRSGLKKKISIRVNSNTDFIFISEFTQAKLIIHNS